MHPSAGNYPVLNWIIAYELIMRHCKNKIVTLASIWLLQLHDCPY